MKYSLWTSLKLTLLCIVLLAVCYPALIWAVAQTAPNHGKGKIIMGNSSKQYYDENIGQNFTADKYFWSRPSAVSYNASGSGGSNKGPNNPEYLKLVEERLAHFLQHHPYLTRNQVPADLITASGSGLDPHISITAAQVQIKRVAQYRHLSENQVQILVKQCTEAPLLGIFGPAKVHVLKLNLALDQQ